MAALLVLLGSCADSKDSTPSATVPRGPTTTVDPYAVPATIDIPYLNRVFAALEKINGDAFRMVMQHRRITPEAAALLDAVMTAEEFERQSHGLSLDVAEGLRQYKDPPGDRRTIVTRILAHEPTCVAVEVNHDYSAVLQDPLPPKAYTSLQREAATSKNPTGWVISKQIRQGSLPCG